MLIALAARVDAAAGAEPDAPAIRRADRVTAAEADADADENAEVASTAAPDGADGPDGPDGPDGDDEDADGDPAAERAADRGGAPEGDLAAIALGDAEVAGGDLGEWTGELGERTGELGEIDRAWDLVEQTGELGEVGRAWDDVAGDDPGADGAALDAPASLAVAGDDAADRPDDGPGEAPADAGGGTLAVLDSEQGPGDTTAAAEAADAATAAGAAEAHEQSVRQGKASRWGRVDVGLAWRRRASMPVHASARRHDEVWLVATWRR